MARWVGIGLAALLTCSLVSAVALTTRSARGYFAPVFAPDGRSIYVVVRDVNASVVGLGYDSLTPPASVWIHRDRFSLITLRLADGRSTLVQEFPPSPLEGAHISAYHGSIFGGASAHLRWVDRDHLEYELTVTRPEVPSSRTYVWRRRWSPASALAEDSAAWRLDISRMSGDEPAQLAGDFEVIAVRGREGLPCAVVILRTGQSPATPLADTGRCGDAYAGGFTRDALGDQLRRPVIEHAALLNKTYADLVAEGRAQGLSDGDAMLRANKGMQRLGLYPKTPTITAQGSACDAMPPVFRISNEEFRVGLFQDLDKAIDHPGEEIDFVGDYVTHRDYDTSKRLNEFLADHGHREFTVAGRGGCWRMTIQHR
jgi:hypothetical protein